MADGKMSRSYYLEKACISRSAFLDIPYSVIDDNFIREVIDNGKIANIPENYLLPYHIVYFIENYCRKLGRLLNMNTEYLKDHDVQMAIAKYFPKKINTVPAKFLYNDAIKLALDSGMMSVLRHLSSAKKTPEMCNYAFYVSKDYFRWIPYEFQSHKMALDAVCHNPEFITMVRFDLLTSKFMEDLENSGVQLDERVYAYISKLISNKTLDSDDEVLKKTPLSNYQDFFTAKIYSFLLGCQVENLYELEAYINACDKSQKTNIRIINSFKLIKCKIFDSDPDVNIMSNDIETELIKMGLSGKTILDLMAKVRIYRPKCIKEIADSVLGRASTFERVFYFVKGSFTEKEFLTKYRIVEDYYENHPYEDRFYNIPTSELERMKTECEAEIVRVRKRMNLIDEALKSRKGNGAGND